MRFGRRWMTRSRVRAMASSWPGWRPAPRRQAQPVRERGRLAVHPVGHQPPRDHQRLARQDRLHRRRAPDPRPRRGRDPSPGKDTGIGRFQRRKGGSRRWCRTSTLMPSPLTRWLLQTRERASADLAGASARVADEPSYAMASRQHENPSPALRHPMWSAANRSSKPLSTVPGSYPAEQMPAAYLSTAIWSVIPATRPPAARWSGPSVRLYRQVPGAGPSRADNVRWTGPALSVARTVTMTRIVAPSKRVLIRVPPHDCGRERSRHGGSHCRVWLRRPGKRTRLADSRRSSRNAS